AACAWRRVICLVLVLVFLLGLVGMFLVPGLNGVLFDALHAIGKNSGDDFLGLLVALAVRVEIGLPVYDCAIRLVVHLEPELRLVVLHWQRALYDLVGVANVLGAGQLFLDLAAVFQRERAEGHVAFLSLLATRNRGMPVLDGAEAADQLPNFRRKTRGLRSLLDRDRIGRAAADNPCEASDQGQFHHTHAFPLHCYVGFSRRARAHLSRKTRVGKASRA